MRLLLIDNFDSFVYNLAQAFGSIGVEPVVLRNDASLDELDEVSADAVCVSPGPGTPESAGVSVAAVKHFAGRVPILGVCLGHQCIGEAFGGRVDRADVGPVHGKTSKVSHDGKTVFSGLPSPFVATRYHSLCVTDSEIPKELEVSATSEDGVVMGVRHRELPIEGVQFHPESVLTLDGSKLLENFVDSAR